MRIRRTTPTALAVLCLTIAACDSGSPSKNGFAIGQRAPEITGTDLNGKPLKLSDYRGQVVVLDFWGNW